MDPRLLKRPPSTRCNCWNRSAQEMKEWKTLRTAQVETVAEELATQTVTQRHCVACVTKLSVLMDDKSLDTGRTCPVRDGVKRWRWMVTCWEPKAFFKVQGMLQAILVMKRNIPGTDVTQLRTVWADQVKDYEQQYSNIWRVQEQLEFKNA